MSAKKDSSGTFGRFGGSRSKFQDEHKDGRWIPILAIYKDEDEDEDDRNFYISGYRAPVYRDGEIDPELSGLEFDETEPR